MNSRNLRSREMSSGPAAVYVRAIRMVQGRKDLCFASEPGESVDVAGKSSPQDVERDVALSFVSDP
jgi:hypothetical protein